MISGEKWVRSGKRGGMRKGYGRDGESIKREGLEDGMEGGRERMHRRKEDDERIGRRGEWGGDEGVGRDENGKRVDRGDGFGDDCFR